MIQGHGNCVTSRKSSMDTIILTIDDQEVHEYVVKGFWQCDPKDRCDYIKYRWPAATWAGNGEPGMWAISHYLTDPKQTSGG